MRVLIAEDDSISRRMLEAFLVKWGYEVQVATEGEEAWGVLQGNDAPRLAVLDWMMPGRDGIDICRSIRQRKGRAYIYILLLTARGQKEDIVEGLEAGADDYVTKPFSPRELVARVKALLRRAEPGTPSEKPVEIGALRIDPAAYRVTRTGKPVPMSTLEFRLLYFLAARPNRVFTRDQLLDAVWGTERFVTPRSVDVYVRRLREKIETDPQHPVFMKTIRGAGYLFETRAS